MSIKVYIFFCKSRLYRPLDTWLRVDNIELASSGHRLKDDIPVVLEHLLDPVNIVGDVSVHAVCSNLIGETSASIGDWKWNFSPYFRKL